MNRLEITEAAYDIAKEYVDDGLTMTLRQLYYQFVARGLIANGQKSYKRIGAAVTAARLAGDFPIEWLEDRTRSMTRTSSWAQLSVDDGLRHAVDEIRKMPRSLVYAGRWHNQPTHVSVFVEKEALAGVLADTCRRLGVKLFPCKGYPSLSSLAQWIEQTAAELQLSGVDEPEAMIIYLGDHDPDGLQIPLTIDDQILALQSLLDRRFDYGMQRVALTMAQIQQHNPPPFPAKVTSARYQAYVDRANTTDAWELDALDPRTLRQLVETHVDTYFDETIAEATQVVVEDARDEFRERLPQVVATAIGDER